MLITTYTHDSLNYNLVKVEIELDFPLYTIYTDDNLTAQGAINDA